MPVVTYIEFGGMEHRVEVPEGYSVMEGATKNDIPGIEADCGGAGACATCHVYVDDAWGEQAGKPSEDELEMLECANDVTDASRLSCQIVIRASLDGLIVRLPESQR